jgi:hypothetical protein
MKTSEYRIEFHAPLCELPYNPDIRGVFLLIILDRKGICQALDMPR